MAARALILIAGSICLLTVLTWCDLRNNPARQSIAISQEQHIDDQDNSKRVDIIGLVGRFVRSLGKPDWTSVATFLLFGVTGLLGFIAYLQIRTSRAQLRAYVVVRFGDVTQNRLLRFETRPVLVNAGQTPALDVRVVSRTEVVPVPVPINFDFKLPEDSRGSNLTLGPQQSFFHTSIMQRRARPLELRRMLATPQRATMFVYGTVRYRDIFGKKRFTNFSYIILARRRGPSFWNATIRNNDSN